MEIQPVIDFINQRGLILLLIAVLAFLLIYFSGRISRRLVSMTRFAPVSRRLRAERQRTLQGILAGLITLTAVIGAIIFCVAQFIDLSTIIWVVGLFSAAFGLGVRPIISDYLTGIFFVVEDTLDVGEKVEILGVEGVVEEVNLRVVLLRGTTGELFVIPNGEIRIIRNFSRGKFSSADVTFKVASKDVQKAVDLLTELSTDAVQLLPNLIEPWMIVSEPGTIGHTAELRLIAKARYGQAAVMRPHLIALVHERLAEAGVELSM